MNDNERNGPQEIIDKAIEEMAREAGDSFELDRLNLAEFSRRTGLTRSKARTLKDKGFVVTPHGRCGMRAESTVILAEREARIPARGEGTQSERQTAPCGGKPAPATYPSMQLLANKPSRFRGWNQPPNRESGVENRSPIGVRKGHGKARPARRFCHARLPFTHCAITFSSVAMRLRRSGSNAIPTARYTTIGMRASLWR